MKSGRKYFVVLVTAPNLKCARKLARGALKERLVACANILPGLESHYWWQGGINSGPEVLILFKTTKAKAAAFEKFVLANHPYDTPEFVALSVASGANRYLDWLTASVK